MKRIAHRNLFILSLLLVVAWSGPGWAKEHYTNELRDQNGKVIVGATVYIYDDGTTNLSTIYSDNIGTAKANPTTTTSDGSYDFYAANGRYDLVFRKTGYTFVAADTAGITLFDEDDFGGDSVLVNGAATVNPDFTSTGSDVTHTNTANVITTTLKSGLTITSPSLVDPIVTGVFIIPNATSNPATCTIGQIHFDNNETAGVNLYGCTATDTWALLGDGLGVSGWPTVSTTKEVTWANSLANAMRVGDGVTPICLYTSSTLGPQIRPCTDSNVSTIIPTNYTWSLFDIEGDAAIETVDPDAASTLAMWTYGAAYRPKASVWFGAGSLDGDGAQCPALATTVQINSGPRIPTMICTDNDASTLYGSVKMPDSWDGGTVTFEHVYIQTAADTAVLNGDIAAQCYGNGEAVGSTWNEVAIDDAAVTGSNKNDFTTSGAVTPAGTCAAGDMLYFRYQLDATGTTTAVATLHHVGFKMEYTKTSRSD